MNRKAFPRLGFPFHWLFLTGIVVTGWLFHPIFSHLQKPVRAAVLPNAKAALTFEDRVHYQQKIEAVWWRHRLWPKENPGPKPAFETLVSPEMLKAQVEAYLAQSDALARQRNQPLTGAELQAEINRMAATTQNPALLEELFAALDHNPYLIAECLARPALVERQPLNPWFKGISNRDLPFVPFEFVLPTIHQEKAASEGNGSNGTWAPLNSGFNEFRVLHTAVWTGVEMIVWGGKNTQETLNTGLRFRPATNSWQQLNQTNSPSGRASMAAVWTGLEMIVWGGENYFQIATNTGGRYNPTTNTWAATSLIGAPTQRTRHTGVWTGTEMIIWGGYHSGSLNTGGRYDPANDSWTATPLSALAPARSQHTAIWTGTEMILFGGFINQGAARGVRYSPALNQWTICNAIGEPGDRVEHQAFWTGTEMLIWGGQFPFDGTQGGKYSPASDSWTSMSNDGQPSFRFGFAGVWTGNLLIVWGGTDNSGVYFNDGAVYSPSENLWGKMNPVNAPTGRSSATAVWTGTEVLLWGFFEPSGRFLPNAISPINIGGFYPLASSPGKTISIYGNGFVPDNTAVTFGGSFAIPAASVTVVNSELLQVVVPPSQIGTQNVNGYLTVRSNGVFKTTETLPINSTQPQNPTATFPEFVLHGDANGDGTMLTADLTLCRAFILFQVVPTARQRLAVDVVPINTNGSRGDGGINAADFVFLRAVSLGQATF